jgi:hypothetical protein
MRLRRASRGERRGRDQRSDLPFAGLNDDAMGMRFASAGSMTKPKTEKAKPKTRTAHPETQPQRAKTGAPGSESSKVRDGARDVRSAHDKDGNGEQRAR